jgi:hypothetical protein
MTFDDSYTTSNGQNEFSSASNYPRKTRSIDIYECDFSEFGTQYSYNVFPSQSRNWNRNNMLIFKWQGCDDVHLWFQKDKNSPWIYEGEDRG